MGLDPQKDGGAHLSFSVPGSIYPGGGAFPGGIYPGAGAGGAAAAYKAAAKAGELMPLVPLTTLPSSARVYHHCNLIPG